MSIITMTSDLGYDSHYAAVLKGIIYTRCPSATVVDITHNVGNFDILEAAYVVKHTFPAYPKNTIHLIAIDPDHDVSILGMVMKYKNQYFIGPNNGVLSLICDRQIYEGRSIDKVELIHPKYPRSFRAAQIFAPAAAYLAAGRKFEEIGEESRLKVLHWGEPSYAGNCLRGKIIYIDKFGNAITNIHKTGFLSLKDGRGFEIFIRNVRLKRIVNTYSDVGKADALAIFGENQHLEIAMREASAADLLGLKVHDMITIEFN